jgi:hypothetical protein
MAAPETSWEGTAPGTRSRAGHPQGGHSAVDRTRVLGVGRRRYHPAISAVEVQVAAEWVPAVTAGITALAALGGQAIAGLIQGRNQERVEARQRRERAAEVLAEVRAYLTDVSPDRLGFNANPERSPETLMELRERRERIRIPLLTLAGSHPSREVRELARRLEVETANTQHWADWFIADLLRSRDVESARGDANQHHEEALRLLDDLLDAIHEPETDRSLEGGLWRRRQLPDREGR